MKSKRDEAIKLLKDIRSMIHNCILLEEEMAKLYTALTSTTIRIKEVDVQSSGAMDPLGDKMAEVIEYQDKLKDYQVALYTKKSMALDVIKTMTASEQELMMLRYFKGYSIEKVAELLDMSYFGMWKKLNKIEEKFCEKYEEIF